MDLKYLTAWERTGFIGGIAMALVLLCFGIESQRLQRCNQQNIAVATQKIAEIDNTLNARAVLLQNLDSDEKQTRAILDSRAPTFELMKQEIAAHHEEIQAIKSQLAATKP